MRIVACIRFSSLLIMLYHLKILLVEVTNEILPCLGVVRDISLRDRTTLQTAALRDAASDRSCEPVLPALNSEVGETNLIRIPRNDRGQPEVLGLNLVVREMQLEVSAVIEIIPM